MLGIVAVSNVVDICVLPAKQLHHIIHTVLPLLYTYIHMPLGVVNIYTALSDQDTIGPDDGVLNSEVSSFQGYSKVVYIWDIHEHYVHSTLTKLEY